MLNKEWPAEDYAIGSYIQATLADSFLSLLHLNPGDKVLDIGCGNGSYTRKILEQVPQGSVLGIDTSENMLRLAKEVSKDYPNFSLQQGDVLTMNFQDQFDKLVSFWCLQWTNDIKKAFLNMMNALKPGGKLFTIFPSGDDPFIMGYYALKESGRFPCLKNFKAPVDYNNLSNLSEKLKSIPCKSIDIAVHHTSIFLPNLEVYKKFVRGLAFYQGQLSEAEVREINEAMIAWYEQECQKHWQGKCRFNLSLYLVRGEK